MQYQRTYLDKCATIVDGSRLNTGFNPVSDIVYGRTISRLLLHFDHERIRKMVKDRTFADTSKLKHTLRMTNASSLDMRELHKSYSSQIDGGLKKRASSFDLVLFLVPRDWDGGKGFNYSETFGGVELAGTENLLSSDGATWYQSANNRPWKTEKQFRKTSDGQFTFYIKADTDTVSHKGGKITFTYSCCCNGGFANRNLVFKSIINSLDRPVRIGQPVFFSKSGVVCDNEADIIKYGEYAKVEVTFPETDDTTAWKYAFRCEYEVDGTAYKSNPYTITTIDNTQTLYTDDGVFSTKEIEKQLELYYNGQDSVIVGVQHFDIGNEDLSIDITDTFNKFISGELENHGLCVAFAPSFEYTECCGENYVGFFTNRTNSFFEPFVETVYTDSVADDRNDFVLGRKNRLYLYSNIGGILENLDNIPTCTIDGEEYEVKQGGKGMYYTEVTLPETAFASPVMLYDTWGGITYQGQDLRPAELEFTTKPASSFFSIGSKVEENQDFTVTTYGINDGEKIKSGDVRKLCFTFRKDYTRNTGVHVDSVEVRLYTMDGTAQVEVMPYLQTERTAGEVYFMIDTSILLPSIYHLDVRVRHGMEMLEHHDMLSFEIAGQENNKYA